MWLLLHFAVESQIEGTSGRGLGEGLWVSPLSSVCVPGQAAVPGGHLQDVFVSILVLLYGRVFGLQMLASLEVVAGSAISFPSPLRSGPRRKTKLGESGRSKQQPCGAFYRGGAVVLVGHRPSVLPLVPWSAFRPNALNAQYKTSRTGMYLATHCHCNEGSISLVRASVGVKMNMFCLSLIPR